MKVIQTEFDLLNNQKVLHKKFIYVAENDSTEIIGYCYILHKGKKKDLVLNSLEQGIYHFNFCFDYHGKYVFVFFENGIKKLIVITTII
jgi:hypothetical protein